MEKSKRNLLFIIVNILLVAVVGVVVGLCVPVTTNSGMILSFVMLLVTLAAPTILFLSCKNINSPVGISSVLALVGNLVATIVLLSLKKEIKVVAITETSIVAVYLIAMLVSIAFLPKKDK